MQRYLLLIERVVTWYQRLYLTEVVCSILYSISVGRIGCERGVQRGVGLTCLDSTPRWGRYHEGNYAQRRHRSCRFRIVPTLTCLRYGKIQELLRLGYLRKGPTNRGKQWSPRGTARNGRRGLGKWVGVTEGCSEQFNQTNRVAHFCSVIRSDCITLNLQCGAYNKH